METSANGKPNTHWRNNLFLGQNSAPAIFSVNTYTNYTSSDYNGFRPNPGAVSSFHWNSPPFTVAADFAPLVAAGRGGGAGAASRLEQRQFPTLAAYSQATSQDRHSVLVDYDIFVNVPKLDAQDRKTVQRVYKAEDFDFRLKPGSAAVIEARRSRGLPMASAGRRRNLGALELGQSLPHYGQDHHEKNRRWFPSLPPCWHLRPAHSGHHGGPMSWMATLEAPERVAGLQKMPEVVSAMKLRFRGRY